jgi:murein DD-endopeptidase MepM/ murein hydrolase activator NlpD
VKKRRPGSHRVSGSVLAAVVVGGCVGALADWQLRDKGPPRPAISVRPDDSAASAAAALPSVAASGNAVVVAEQPAPSASAMDDLARRGLRVPIDGMEIEPLKGGFDERRGGGTRPHEAVDILAPRNTPIHAVEDGTIARLFFSKAGGNTIYQFDPSGRFCYYYAHLERYADGLREGAHVSRSQILGEVGTTGNAPPNTPHLHFAIFELTSARHWWQGVPIDPYRVFHSNANSQKDDDQRRAR